MPTINLKSNAKRLLDQVNSDRRELKERAIVRALNRTGDQVRTAAGREIRKVYNLPADRVREQMTVTRAWAGRLAVTVTASGYAVPLADFKATWRASWAGARFSVRKGERKTLAGTFIATMKSGHKGVFERSGAKRLPIEEKFSIGVPGMFGAQQVQTILESIALDRFEANLDSQISYLFR